MAEYIKREESVNRILCLTIVDPAVSQYADAVLTQIQQMPAADVAPVIRGSWKLLRHDRFSDVFQCSECGRKVSLTHGRDVLEQFPYCHCGAKMEDAPCPEHQP